ncbi:MAG: DnaA/Hda family protein, partial [Gemmatimonadetes bacterium]|nr:DnaA/Hda family protein [Gemmatimonadota bacterium]
MTTRTLTQRLADRIGSHKYDMWFDRTAKLTVSAERVEVATGSQFVADWIASHFSDDLRGVASEALGRPADVHIHVDPDLFDQDSARREHRRNGSQTSEKTDRVERSTPEADRTAKPHRNSLRRRLDDFVVGQSNELAFCASTRLAESQATAEVSPLFLHGDCGVGKTHLLQGICQRFAERGNRGAVRYVTAEQFTNEFIASVRNG